MSNYCSVWGRCLTPSSVHKHQVMALCNGPIVSCHGSQSACESSGPSGGERHFTLNIHVVLLVLIGWRTLRQWISNIIMNKPSLCAFKQHTQTSSVLFFNTLYHVFVKCWLHFTCIFFSHEFMGIKGKKNRWQCVDVGVSSALTLTSRWYQILNFLVLFFLSLHCSLTLWEYYNCLLL